MMGSPAQVSDDIAGGKNSTAVQSVSATPVAPIHHGRGLIKYEWKVKKMDASKLNSPKRMNSKAQRLSLNTLKKETFTGMQIERIKDDPVPNPPGNGRPNGGGGLGSDFRNRIINITPLGNKN